MQDAACIAPGAALSLELSQNISYLQHSLGSDFDPFLSVLLDLCSTFLVCLQVEVLGFLHGQGAAAALLCSIPLQWPWWIFSTFFSILGWGGHGCGCWETLLPVCRNARLKPSPRALPPFLLPSLPILSGRKSGGLFVLALHGQDSSSMLVSEPSSSPHLRSCRITSSPSCTPIFPFCSDASLHVMHRESL